MAALITVQYHYGWGRHFAYLEVEDRVEALKYNAIGQSFGELYINRSRETLAD